ncbi:hypothetical protein CVT24_001131 [Panaeolus cyanescens]|uniref:Chromo domain-containing protein n=1 Tax=Panaeolus cyanescens TaxID=181874 RepID=A0A409W6R3_9AGAR|nr:hypothetical protein CVT24_001131 [Panaeolus cyanescens]
MKVTHSYPVLQHNRIEPGPTLHAFDDAERKRQIGNKPLFSNPHTMLASSIVPDTTTEFIYPNPILPPDCDKLQAQLIPPEPIQAAVGVYPSASCYSLLKDSRYYAGYAYITSYKVESSTAHKERLLAIQTPAACNPVFRDGRYVVESIPGMVKLIPGIPFGIFLNGDDNRIQTVACVHTLDSLSHFPDFPDMEAASIRLAQLTWGTGTELSIFELKGLKKNDRSFLRESQEYAHDGSYSLGNTIMKGDGPGTLVPAVQSRDPITSARIISVLQTLHKLHRLILPKCITKFEFDICDFHANYTNMFSSGGLEPASTSVQMNVSSLGKDLSSSIGEIQGRWHTDVSDDPNRFTLFVLLLRVSPTGHPGVFCLARWGLYCAEIGAWILFMVFKGVDMHSGFAPKDDDTARNTFLKDAEVNAAYKMAGSANRVGYVMYCSKVATHRTGSINATKPTGFGNVASAHTSRAAGKQSHLDFGAYGPMSLGSFKDCANRMAREAVFSFYNTLVLSNLNIKLDLDALLGNIYGNDEEGKEFVMSPIPYNPQRDSERIQTYISYYTWYSMECASIYVCITKEELKARQAYLQSETVATAPQGSNPRVNLAAGSGKAATNIVTIQPATIFSPSSSHQSNRPPTSSDPSQSNDNAGSDANPTDILKAIKQVISCCQTDKEMIFSVILEDTPKPIRVSSSILPGIKKHPLILKFLREQVRPEWQEQHQAVYDNNLENTSDVNNNNDVSSTPIASSTDHRITSSSNNISQSVAQQQVNSPAADSTNERQPHETDIDVQHGGTKRPIDQVDASNSEYESDDEELDEGRDHEADDEEYEVDDILEHAITEDDQLIFSVKWKGCNEITWEPCQNLVNSLETVSRYVIRQNMDFPSELKSATNKPRKRIKQTNGDPQHDMLQLADNFQHLYNMLAPSRIRALARQLEKEYNDYSNNQAFWKNSSPTNTNAFIKILANSSRENIILDEYISILSTDNPLSATVLEFNLLNEAAKFLPQMKPFVHTSPFLQRAIRAEVCNAWIRAYQWHVVKGHELTTELMELHREHGSRILSHKWPQFAQIVDHVVRFLADHFQKELTAAKSISARARSKIQSDCQYIQSLCTTVALDPIHMLPANLYGLVNNLPAPKPISLLTFQLKSPVFSRRDNIAAEFIYSTYGPSILFDILSTAVICPAIERFDIFTRVKPSARTSYSTQDISQRAILRGALLHSLQKACGGNAIFFYDGIDDFLHSPTSVFPNRNGNTYDGFDARMYKSLIHASAKRTEQNLQPLFDAISAMVQRYPDIGRQAATIKRVTFQVINGLSCGHRIYDDDIDLEDCRPKSKPKRPIKLQMPLDLPTYKPKAEDIAPGITVGLGTLGLIVQEALNYKRSAPVCSNEVRQILIGSNPLQFSQSLSHNSSHTDPIRSFSEYAQLFNTHMTPSLLATRLGLSNLLSYMGTGQGTGTKAFLNIIANRNTQYFSKSLTQIAEMFQTALSYNAAIFGATPNAVKLAGFIHCFDTRVWGQPSRSFSLAPEGNDNFKGVKAKFEPYWTDSVQDKWTAFLGPMLDQNPMEWVGPKASWTEAYHLLIGLQISGFQSGLTVFQCANNLALAGICMRPTTSELACWIGKNRNLGAWRGLKTLGFHIDDKKGCAVFAAFTTLYQHLDRSLSDSDKQVIDFGPMFLEHLLCKVSRYAHRWTGFTALAKDKEKEDVDSTTFPFPLVLSQDGLQAIIDEIRY